MRFPSALGAHLVSLVAVIAAVVGWVRAVRAERPTEAEVAGRVARDHTAVATGEADCASLLVRVRDPKTPGLPWFWWTAVADGDTRTGLALREVSVGEGYAPTKSAAVEAGGAFHNAAHTRYGHGQDDYTEV